MRLEDVVKKILDALIDRESAEEIILAKGAQAAAAAEAAKAAEAQVKADAIAAKERAKAEAAAAKEAVRTVITFLASVD